MRLCRDGKRLSRPRVGSPHFDGIWKSQGRDLKFTVRSGQGKPPLWPTLHSPHILPRRPGSGTDGHGSALLLPRGRARQMPTWQRLGLAVPPRRLGQGRSPRGRWSLEPRVRVRQAVSKQVAAGRESGSLWGSGRFLIQARESIPYGLIYVCVAGVVWGREDGTALRECVGRQGRDRSEGDGGGPFRRWRVEIILSLGGYCLWERLRPLRPF